MPDYNRTDRNAAKMIAILALVVALIALVWAFKADRKAADAIKRAREAHSTNHSVSLDNDNAGDDSMRSSTDTQGNVETQEPTDTGAPDGPGVNSQTDATDAANQDTQ